MAALAFVTCLIVFGVVYSFGAFFKPMASEFGASRATTAGVFAITAGAYNLLGIVGGHLSDRLGPRPVVITGALALGLGLLSTSYIDRLWLIYLTYGLGIGIGVALNLHPNGCPGRRLVPAAPQYRDGGGGVRDRMRHTALCTTYSMADSALRMA
jgi:MFS family permease